MQRICTGEPLEISYSDEIDHKLSGVIGELWIVMFHQEHSQFKNCVHKH